MFNQLLKFSYWFDTYPLFFTPVFFWVLLSLFLALTILGTYLAVRVSKQKMDSLKKKIFSKFFHWSLSAGIAGLILVFFKQQRTPYLGMRIWILIWLIICFIWLIFVLKFLFRQVPKIKKEQQEKQEFEKYLPK